MFSVQLFLGILVCLCRNVLSYTYHMGSNCPIVQPQKMFAVSAMSGNWYVVLKTSTAEECIIFTYKYTKHGLVLEESTQHTYLHLYRFRYDYVVKKQSGRIRGSGAVTTVHFPLSVFGPVTHTMLSTDFISYAIVFLCQPLAFAHRRAVVVLSKSKYATAQLRKSAHYYAYTYNRISVADLSDIRHEDCAYDKYDKSRTKFYEFNPESFCFKTMDGFLKTLYHVASGSIDYLYEYTRKFIDELRVTAHN